MQEILFLLLGLAVGLIGTLIGAGGGFLLSPILIFVFPTLEPVRLTALSLLAVAANSTSGSIAYARRKVVHWKSVAVFAIAALPGVALGVYLVDQLSRDSFERIFAFFLLSMSVFVLWRSFKKRSTETVFRSWSAQTAFLGGAISFFVGIISSLLGIGGGIVHVPLLAEVLKYPVHLAAGTSHAILAITSVAAVALHFWHGDLANLEPWTWFMVGGLIVGAQLGARLSKHVKSHLILRLLALALLAVSIRLFLKN